MRFRTTHHPGGRLPVAYVLELGDEEALWKRDENGGFVPIASLAEVKKERIQTFGTALGLIVPCLTEIVDPAGMTIGTFEVSVVEGRLGCTSIKAAPGQELTGRFVREIPFARLIRQATLSNLVRLLKDEEGQVFGARYVQGGPGFGSAWRHLQDDLHQRISAHRTLSDAFLLQVADVYRDAVQAQEPPGIKVAWVLGPTSRGNARKWIMAARKRGFLGPAPAERRRGEG